MYAGTAGLIAPIVAHIYRSYSGHRVPGMLLVQRYGGVCSQAGYERCHREKGRRISHREGDILIGL